MLGLIFINVGERGRTTCLCSRGTCTCCVVVVAKSSATAENSLWTPIPAFADVVKVLAWCRAA